MHFLGEILNPIRFMVAEYLLTLLKALKVLNLSAFKSVDECDEE